MPPYSLAHKAYDITQATALAAESPRTWADIFAHIYCGLLSEADEEERERESHLMGLDLSGIERLVAARRQRDDECHAETFRALEAREPSPVDAEAWFARVAAILDLGSEDRTELER